MLPLMILKCTLLPCAFQLQTPSHSQCILHDQGGWVVWLIFGLVPMSWEYMSRCEVSHGDMILWYSMASLYHGLMRFQLVVLRDCHANFCYLGIPCDFCLLKYHTSLGVMPLFCPFKQSEEIVYILRYIWVMCFTKIQTEQLYFYCFKKYSSSTG